MFGVLILLFSHHVVCFQLTFLSMLVRPCVLPIHSYLSPFLARPMLVHSLVNPHRPLSEPPSAPCPPMFAPLSTVVHYMFIPMSALCVFYVPPSTAIHPHTHLCRLCLPSPTSISLLQMSCSLSVHLVYPRPTPSTPVPICLLCPVGHRLPLVGAKTHHLPLPR